jgi:hypothetical protein
MTITEQTTLAWDVADWLEYKKIWHLLTLIKFMHRSRFVQITISKSNSNQMSSDDSTTNTVLTDQRQTVDNMPNSEAKESIEEAEFQYPPAAQVTFVMIAICLSIFLVALLRKN